MTSLPPEFALYHMRAKIFQRSKGRSSVAAAAYRSASLLHDERTGETFDYRKKHCVESFILAPTDAPEWVQDREQLWNRIEAAERNKAAQVAREVEISIPRDIPESQWKAFAEEVCSRYVEAGAVVDIAIHAPTAADKNPNPHIHAMLTMRSLDASRETGFAKAKSASIEQIFSSGGRYGGQRGDALKAERARIADIANRYLAAAGSPRRVTHRSWADLGIDREAEPDMGETRLHAVKGRKKHDRKTAQVSAIRAARKTENELTQIEEEIMAMNPVHQIKNGIRPARKQDFKMKLLSERFPGADLSGFKDEIYQVDARSSSKTIIRMRDRGWLECENGLIHTYGPKGQAEILAQRLVISGHANSAERLEETASYQRRGSGLRQRRRRGEALPEQPLSVVEQRAEFWRALGYTHVNPMPDGVFISIGSCKIQDLGDELKIHGKPSDDAARAMVLKAAEQWSGEMEVFGSKTFKDMMWLESMRQGVSLYDADTGRLYEPSPDIKKSWEEATAKLAEATGDLEALEKRKELGSLMRRAASGDVEAAVELERNDMELADFLNRHLDKQQRAEFAQGSDGEIAEDLDLWRKLGAEARAQDEQDGRAEQTPALSQRLAAEARARSRRDKDNDRKPEMAPA